jgi:hypothetical protein
MELGAAYNPQTYQFDKRQKQNPGPDLVSKE